ncbi:MAG: hypothetical protein AAB215_08770 [Planctomycetota bacterium]
MTKETMDARLVAFSVLPCEAPREARVPAERFVNAAFGGDAERHRKTVA